MASELRRKKPYYRYNLAQKAMEQGELDLALEHIQAAIRGYLKEHRFHHLAAVIYYLKGDSYHLQKDLKQAAEVTLNKQNYKRYCSKLENLLVSS